MESFPESSCELQNFIQIMGEIFILDESKLNDECEKTPAQDQFYDDF